LAGKYVKLIDAAIAFVAKRRVRGASDVDG
jgi:hypothetical protein